MPSKPTIALTTTIKPARLFTVDGEEFQLLDMDHLSPDQEAETLALFSRFALLAQELDMTQNVTKGVQIATRLRETRERILGMMTNLPKAVISNLPMSQQALLVEALQDDLSEEAGAAGTDEDDQQALPVEDED